MDAEKVKYSAFISYRHLPMDRQWAVWLMEALETYRTPKALTRQGYDPRIRHLFRDEDEMPASSDLSDQIVRALAKSEFLIVICSPATPASEWVRQEISTFRRMGKGDRIIAVLIDGEPKDSYPPEIYGPSTAIGIGSLTEPYAADVRPRKDEHPRKVKRRALLRLAAPILGCAFDDLAQRDLERERSKRLKLAAASVVGLLLCAGLGVFWVKDSEGKQAVLLHTQANQLAQSAITAISAHRDDEALRLAMAAARKDADFKGPSLGRTELVAVMSSIGWKRVIRTNSPVSTVVFSRDGATLATASKDKGVDVWDAASGRHIARIGIFPFPIRTLEFNPDGTRILVSFGSGPPQVWDIAQKKAVFTLIGHGQPVVGSAHYDQSGKRIVTASIDRTARIWDAQTGQMLKILQGSEMMQTARFSPDGNRVLTTYAATNGVDVWDADSGNRVLTIDTDSRISTAQFSPDGAEIFDATEDRDGHIWDAKTGTQITKFVAPGVILNTAFAGQGRRIMTTALEREAPQVWDAQTGELLMELQGHAAPTDDIASSPDGRGVATASDDQTIRIWPPLGQTSTLFPHWAGKYGIAKVAFTKDGRKVIVVNGNKLGVYNRDLDKIQTNITIYTTFGPSLSLSEAGSKMFLVGPDGKAALANLDTGNIEKTFPDFSPLFSVPIDALLLSPDGTKLFVERGDQAAVSSVADLKNSQPMPSMTGQRYGRGAIFSYDNTYMANVPDLGAYGKAKRIQVFQVGNPAFSAAVGDSTIYNSAAFNHRGNLMIVAASDKLSVWNIKTGKEIIRLATPGTQALEARFNPQDTQVIAALEDGTVRVWDVQTGLALLTLRGHRGAVTHLAVSSDGRAVVSSGKDEDVRLWETPYLVMTTEQLLHEGCAKLAGVSRLTEAELAAAGLKANDQQADVCIDLH